MNLRPIECDKAQHSTQDEEIKLSHFQPAHSFSAIFLVWALTILLGTACSGPLEDPSAGDTADAVSERSTTGSLGIDFFQGSLEEALESAENQEKFLFVSVCTTWSGPCIVMQDTVYPLPEIGNYFNDRFVNLMIDIENEDQNGPSFGTRYGVTLFPTHLILNSEGDELGRFSGGASASQLMEMVRRVLGESESTFEDMQARFDSGERSAEFVQQYLLEAIVELAFREVRHQDIASARAYLDEREEYKKKADEYFESMPYADLINETDAHLVLYFHERTPRGGELVEFVIEHYDEFLEVSTDSAMTQFTLNATLRAVAIAARSGDERMFSYIEALESYPLSKAVEYERDRHAQSRLLPEHMRLEWETEFLKSNGDWDGVYEVIKKRLEARGENATATHFRFASMELRESEKPEHHKVAVEYSRKAYKLDNEDPDVLWSYILALLAVGQLDDEFDRILEEYQSTVSNSEVDQSKLEELHSSPE